MIVLFEDYTDYGLSYCFDLDRVDLRWRYSSPASDKPMTSPTVPCPSCASVNAAGSRFCSSCGQRIDVFSQAPTVVVHEPATPRVGRLISSDSVPVGGFAPGVILADRYRIIGLLGRGGMGEVYRADDLKLGQAVALKFLPPALADDPVRRERFFAEVRIARQLSHPNVCRVYDISEFEGRHFLSMEYIDGEDLASLLQRIGHFSNEKAVDIARQLVAGLSAAHERGVLHRDLKPSNVMLDGLGRVRITDFGLAIAADDEAQAADVSGTPAYMAPEQLAGKGATVRSDIYSLGLILYEIHTGKPAFRAASIAELREQKATRTPTAPSDLRPGVIRSSNASSHGASIASPVCGRPRSHKWPRHCQAVMRLPPRSPPARHHRQTSSWPQVRRKGFDRRSQSHCSRSSSWGHWPRLS